MDSITGPRLISDCTSYGELELRFFAYPTDAASRELEVKGCRRLPADSNPPIGDVSFTHLCHFDVGTFKIGIDPTGEGTSVAQVVEPEGE
jgi:hypothetical protein